MCFKKISFVVVAFLSMTVAAQAGLIVYDHFDGATVDSTLWSVDNGGSNAAAAQASSVVTLTSPTGDDYVSLYSQTAVGDHYGMYEFKIGSTFTGDRNFFGFNNSNNNAIYVYDNGNGAGYRLQVIANGTYSDNVLTTNTAPQAGEIYTIDWSAAGVDVYINGMLNFHETLSPDPSVEALKYRLLCGWGTGSMGMDYVGEQVVPEPGMLILLTSGLLGLLCYAWRKRK